MYVQVDKENRFTEKPKDKEAEKKKKGKEKEKEKKKKAKAEAASKKVEDDGWAQVGTPVKRGGATKGKNQTGSGPNSPVCMCLCVSGCHSDLIAHQARCPVFTVDMVHLH